MILKVVLIIAGIAVVVLAGLLIAVILAADNWEEEDRR